MATTSSTCYRCGGTGVYQWGGSINGVARHSGPCFRCVGGGEFPAVARTVPGSHVDLTCPKCKRPGARTKAEAAKRYVCRDCADIEEGAF